MRFNISSFDMCGGKAPRRWRYALWHIPLSRYFRYNRGLPVLYSQDLLPNMSIKLDRKVWFDRAYRKENLLLRVWCVRLPIH